MHPVHDGVPDDAAVAYSIAEVAQRLGVHRTTVDDLIRDGKLGSVKIGARRVIPRASLLALLEGTEHEAAER
jgi:excisionase family DNA binding protein